MSTSSWKNEQVVLTFGQHFESPQIEVNVGSADSPTRKSFLVHESALVQASEYFKGSLSVPMKEKNTRSVNLEEDVDDPEAFALFLQHAYCGTALSTQMLSLTLEKGQLVQFAKLYALADRLISPSTREFAYGVLRDRLQNGQATSPKFFVDDLVEAVAIIYRHTPSPTPPEEISTKKLQNLKIQSETDDDGEVTESTGDIESSRRIRALLIQYLIYNIKTVREQKKADLAELARLYEDFCVDMLGSEDLVSATTTRQGAATNPIGVYGLGYAAQSSTPGRKGFSLR